MRTFKLTNSSILPQIIGAALFGLSVWVRTEPGFVDWVSKLELIVFFIGIYILIAVGIIVMGLSFLGCLSSLMENMLALYVFIGSQILGFVLSVVGSAVLLNFSTMNSNLQPMIRDIMNRFVMTSETQRSSAILKMIQEAVSVFFFYKNRTLKTISPRLDAAELMDPTTTHASTNLYHHNAVTLLLETHSSLAALTN